MGLNYRLSLNLMSLNQDCTVPTRINTKEINSFVKKRRSSEKHINNRFTCFERPWMKHTYTWAILGNENSSGGAAEVAQTRLQ